MLATHGFVPVAAPSVAAFVRTRRVHTGTADVKLGVEILEGKITGRGADKTPVVQGGTIGIWTQGAEGDNGTETAGFPQ